MSEEGGLNSDTFYEAPTQKERKYSVKQRNKNNCPQVNSLSEGAVNNFVGAMVRVSCAGVFFVDTQRHKPSRANRQPSLVNLRNRTGEERRR